MAGQLRSRATAVVVRDGNVLLVRQTARADFGMPGGGIERGELPLNAVGRELREETSLRATKIEYLFNYATATNNHTVFRTETEGDVAIGHEIDAFIWWDRNETLPLFPHVRGILSKLENSE